MLSRHISRRAHTVRVTNILLTLAAAVIGVMLAFALQAVSEGAAGVVPLADAGTAEAAQSEEATFPFDYFPSHYTNQAQDIEAQPPAH